MGLTGTCGAYVLTVVSVAGPAEVPEPPVAQLEGGLAALPQGSAVPQREGGVLRTPVGDEAVLLASGGRGQGEHVTGPAGSTPSDHPPLGEERKPGMTLAWPLDRHSDSHGADLHDGVIVRAGNLLHVCPGLATTHHPTRS